MSAAKTRRRWPAKQSAAGDVCPLIFSLQSCFDPSSSACLLMEDASSWSDWTNAHPSKRWGCKSMVFFLQTNWVLSTLVAGNQSQLWRTQGKQLDCCGSWGVALCSWHQDQTSNVWNVQAGRGGGSKVSFTGPLHAFGVRSESPVCLPLAFISDWIQAVLPCANIFGYVIHPMKEEMKVGTLEGSNGNSLACLSLLLGLCTPLIVLFCPRKRLCLTCVQLPRCSFAAHETTASALSFSASAVTPSALLQHVTWFHTILRLFLPWPNLCAATCVQDLLGWTATSEGTYLPWARLGFQIFQLSSPCLTSQSWFAQFCCVHFAGNSLVKRTANIHMWEETFMLRPLFMYFLTLFLLQSVTNPFALIFQSLQILVTLQKTSVKKSKGQISSFLLTAKIKVAASNMNTEFPCNSKSKMMCRLWDFRLVSDTCGMVGLHTWSVSFTLLILLSLANQDCRKTVWPTRWWRWPLLFYRHLGHRISLEWESHDRQVWTNSRVLTLTWMQKTENAPPLCLICGSICLRMACRWWKHMRKHLIMS